MMFRPVRLTERLIYDLGGAEEKPEVLAGLIGEIGISSRFTPDAREYPAPDGPAAPSRADGPRSARRSRRWPDPQRAGISLEQEGADLRHTVLCHMNPSFADKRYQRELAQRGASISSRIARAFSSSEGDCADSSA
jgi:phosphotriesterase-related protein